MKTKFTLLLMSCFLLAGIWLSGNGQIAENTPPRGVFAWSPPTAEQLREDLVRCKQNVLDAELRISHLKYLLEAIPPTADDFERRDRWKTELKKFEDYELKLLCYFVKSKEEDIAALPTPTPTPGIGPSVILPPTPTPTPSPSPGPRKSTERATELSPTPTPTPGIGPSVVQRPTPTPTPSPSPGPRKSTERATEQSATPTPTPGIGPSVVQRPTPTPAPTPTATPSKEQEEVRKQLEEIIDGLDPLTAEINDWVKKRKAQLPPVKAPDGLETNTRWQPGLQTVSFDLPQGSIVLNLPDDMRAGDTISGTVTVEPKGPTETERNQNSTALQNFAIELTMPDTTIWRVPLSTERKNFAFVMGSNPGNGTVGCNLVTRNGADVANVNVPISPAPPVTPNATAARPANFPFASLGQTGQPLEIEGAFDGSSANTKVTVGGKPANTLAESPRKCVFESPRDVTGPTEVQVNEGGREGRGAYRNIDVRLSAPKLNLSKGEKTTITVEITGLSGIQRDVPLQLEKTGTVTMERGDVQHLQIHPQDVNPNGSFVLTRGLTGVQAGGFNVTATVFDPTRRPVIIPLSEGARVNGYRLIRSGRTASFGAENVIDPTTGKPLNGEHKLRAGCGQPSLADLPLLALRFKNGNALGEKTDCFIFVTPRIIKD